jgi:transglutaminase-like putative cysteine protease
MTMATRPTQPPRPRPSRGGGELSSAQWSMTVTPVVAAITVLCGSLALSGIIDGMRWWGYAGVAVTVVAATGLGLRAMRTPIVLVGIGQMFALLCLLVALFTDSAVLGFLPGPSAIGELGDVLGSSIDVVRTGVPPVAATSAVLCLVVIAIGLVAVLVDTLAVSAGAPAACGLVLLCVYAVPASLADAMLPWWSFVLGATSFAALLAVDGAHRHQQWRNRPTVQGTGVGIGSPVALLSGALAIALLAGATFTVIGTVGQLPGGAGSGGAGGLGLKPFTELRGMLDREENVELFRVRGLNDDARYLRALTLSEYNANGGWVEPRRLPRGNSANGDLPVPPGRLSFGQETKQITIEPVNSEDVWAPVFGTPVRMRDLPEGMRYDRYSGMIYGQKRQTLARYIETADLTEPNAEQLRAAGDDYSSQVNEVYTENDDIDPQVTEIADEVTAGQPTAYDKTLAILNYFDTSNGFTYDTRTATGSDEDGLTDFLTRSKTGFCEQYASAMAILLRAAGIPSRVAMGYTGGYPSGDYRTITTSDAHAWVEVFFPNNGWVTFDPTPLGNGRSYEPPYADDSDSTNPQDDPTEQTTQTNAPSTQVGPTDTPGDEQTQAQDDSSGRGERTETDAWIWITAAFAALVALVLTVLTVRAGRGRPGADPGRAQPRRLLLSAAVVGWTVAAMFVAALVSWWLAVLVVVLLIAALPSVVREQRRLAHRHAVHASATGAATAAWTELLAESSDRGGHRASTETVRGTARRLAADHDLDDGGRQALRTVVSEVERSWYGGRTSPDPTLGPAFDEVVAGLRRGHPLTWRDRLFPRSVLRRRR